MGPEEIIAPAAVALGTLGLKALARCLFWGGSSASCEVGELEPRSGELTPLHSRGPSMGRHRNSYCQLLVNRADSTRGSHGCCC